MAFSTLEAIQYYVAVLLQIDLSLEDCFKRLHQSQLLAWLLFHVERHWKDPTCCALILGLVVLVVRDFQVRRRTSVGRGVKGPEAEKEGRAGKGRVELSEEEVDELVEEWQPEPLVTPLTKLERTDLEKRPTIIGAPGLRVKLSTGRSNVTNLASHDTFNLLIHPVIREAAIGTLRHYGVGACGPPGFYGTKDVDIQLERDIASFLGVQASIVYAQSFSTISSVIPAFAKRGDVIVVDIGCSWPIVKGLQLSRSTIRWYKHNDVQDLERVLEGVRKEFGGSRLTRRFIVTEAIFAGSGEIIDLPAIIRLKHKYKYRVILDETHSFPILGRTCRGITEYQGVDPTDVDILVGSLSHTLCNMGGFCAGSYEIVEHQRISGTAYVFSAALPAMYSVAASRALEVLKNHGHEYGAALEANIAAFRAQIEREADKLEIISALESPTILICFKKDLVDRYQWVRDREDWVIQETLDEASRNGLLLTKIRAIDPSFENIGTSDHPLPRPAMKICISTGFSVKDMDKAGRTVRTAAMRALKRNC